MDYRDLEKEKEEKLNALADYIKENFPGYIPFIALKRDNENLVMSAMETRDILSIAKETAMKTSEKRRDEILDKITDSMPPDLKDRLKGALKDANKLFNKNMNEGKSREEFAKELDDFLQERVGDDYNVEHKDCSNCGACESEKESNNSESNNKRPTNIPSNWN